MEDKIGARGLVLISGFWFVVCVSFGFYPPLSVLSFAAPQVGPQPGFAEVVQSLKPLIEHELEDKRLPSIAVALVDDQRIVWAEGFGWSDPGRKAPASAGTVYRVGSVSKLFTDIGIMQLVEQGKLNLDAPVASYLGRGGIDRARQTRMPHLKCTKLLSRPRRERSLDQSRWTFR
ncbi:MAG TPA: serine hydrolase domain-containing protein [Terriglobia bacterium]|nr:serine hydrolase domain-containing protein [Terriglobia bacterium]